MNISRKIVLTSLLSISSLSMHASLSTVAVPLGQLTLAGVIGAIALRNDAINYNPKAHKKQWLSDLQTAASLTGTVLLADWIWGDLRRDWAQHLTICGLVTATHFIANNNSTGNCLRSIPVIGGFFADPVDENGNERFGLRRLGRCIATYFGLRYLASLAGLPVATIEGTIEIDPDLD